VERLQAAIEKARKQRGKPASQNPRRTQQKTPSASPQNLTMWESLPEADFKREKLHRNRVLAFEGGQESAPFDMLRTRMLQQAKQHGWKRIAIVSPHSNCGKSTMAANLGFSLARQRDTYSIVLDFDLRRAGLTKILEQHSDFGMSDVIKRKADFADAAKRYGPNVAFGINTGAKVNNPSEILQSSQTSGVLSEISATYEPDIMLFDMPPLMASDDNFGFLKNVDCALILVAAEKTPMSQIDVAERHVSELTNVMGIILNKCRYPSKAHGYEYDYY